MTNTTDWTSKGKVVWTADAGWTSDIDWIAPERPQDAGVSEAQLTRLVRLAAIRGGADGGFDAISYAGECGGDVEALTFDDCPSPLSGEMAGESVGELLSDLIGRARAADDYDAEDQICEAYEEAYTSRWCAVVDEYMSGVRPL